MALMLSPETQCKRDRPSSTATTHYRVLTISPVMLISTLFDAAGKPSFNALQNYGSAAAPVFFYVFDVLVLNGQEVMGEPLSRRRELLVTKVLPLLSEPIRYSPVLDAPLGDLIESVKTQGLEG